MIELTLYSKPGCHLCDDMLAELRPIADGKARVTVVDISQDSTLTNRFGLSIPVLMHGDEEISRYRLDTAIVTELIATESR